MPVNDRILMRRGSAAQWTAVNPVLFAGEIGAELDTGRMKVGDGTTAWTSLAYVGGGSGITQLTGDVTAGPGTGSVAATIANNAVTTGKILNSNVTLAKIANAAANSRVLGSGSAGSGSAYSELSLGDGLTISGTTLNASAASTVVPRAALYLPFTLGANDDEFDDASFTGWTTVQDASPTVVTVEAGDRLSVAHPGGDTAGELHAFMKNITPATNDFIEIGFRINGRGQNFQIAGLIFADGATYGAGNQVVFHLDATSVAWYRGSHTNYSTAGAFATFSQIARQYTAVCLLRFKYEGSNNFRGYYSVDGNQWTDLTGSFSRTLSPTWIGFYCSTWGGASTCQFSFEYFRHGS